MSSLASFQIFSKTQNTWFEFTEVYLNLKRNNDTFHTLIWCLTQITCKLDFSLILNCCVKYDDTSFETILLQFCVQDDVSRL